MEACVRSKFSRIVTQINADQFLVEGEIDFARFGFESNQNNLTFADIDGGPFLHIGQDFFGKGKIESIENIDSQKNGYIILKVTLIDKDL